MGGTLGRVTGVVDPSFFILDFESRLRSILTF
jgi:hypothetical protein